ncbi:MAG: hypothetical protein HYW04_07270 [Deltaproteobacteria bacterium]|nr:hypothetical protein [Deltaproteobacteria bacterium]
MEELDKSCEYLSGVCPVWCPGCGYYGILSALVEAFADLKLPTKELTLVSGIGCSSRLPYFVKAYGFHSIHGRGLPIAQGVKTANPELTVLAVGGDGDGLAIGGGHLPHVARNNVDITYLLFNNAIYGMTKGQFSPTTTLYPVTKTSPFGLAADHPGNPSPRLFLHRGARQLLLVQHHRHERGAHRQESRDDPRGSQPRRRHRGLEARRGPGEDPSRGFRSPSTPHSGG